jgi:hypothetical protein
MLAKTEKEFGIWLISLLENVAKYRIGERDLTQLTEQIDQYAQSD